MRHFAEQTCAAQPHLGGDTKQNAVEPADVPVFQKLQLQTLKLGKSCFIGGGTKDTRIVFGVHLRGHRREGENPLDFDFTGVLDQPAAKCVLRYLWPSRPSRRRAITVESNNS